MLGRAVIGLAVRDRLPAATVRSMGRWRRATLVSAAALMLGACGRSTDGSVGAPAPLPATTLFTGSFPTVPLTAPGAAKALEGGASWCPPQWLPDDAKDPFAGASVAERNLGVLVAYAAEHPVEAAGPWLDLGHDPARIVAGFTSAVSAHRAAVLALVADRDRVHVCQVRHSDARPARSPGAPDPPRSGRPPPAMAR